MIGYLSAGLNRLIRKDSPPKRSYYKASLDLKSPARKCQNCNRVFDAHYDGNRGFRPGFTICPGCGSRKTFWLDA